MVDVPHFFEILEKELWVYHIVEHNETIIFLLQEPYARNVL